MYRLDWETPIMGGALRAPHGLDTPLVFDNSSLAPNLVGPGPVPARLGAEMSQAWINFARTGNPSQAALTWPRYEAGQRKTMIFDSSSKTVSDPDRERRTFWQSRATNS
jgi:para-nitrobenzyl esterase